MNSSLQFGSDEELETVVRRLESCDFRLDEFHHVHHVAVAVSYARRFPPEEALARMRDSLFRFTEHHHRSGYHETLTRFWMELVREYVESECPERSAYEQANQAVRCLGDKDLVYAFYTRERVLSEEARHRWMEPDLKPIAEIRAHPPPASG